MFNVHITTGITSDGTNVNLTVSHATNIASFTPFDLVLTKCPSSVVTGSPLPYTITINGENVSVFDRYVYPINSDELCMRKRYYGAYVVNGTNKYLVLWNTRDREV
jgi:hypothetical protein